MLSRCVEAWEARSIGLEHALAEAQAWLREKATVEIVRKWVRGQIDTEGMPDAQLELVHEHLLVRDQNELMFADAIYWAPFHITGRSIRVR